MKYLAILGLALLGVFASSAQEPKAPDWTKIEFEVTSPSSPYHYPALMERYMQSDTTLSFEDYFHLYYGYVFQDDYKPLMKYPEADSLTDLFGKRTTPSPETFKKALGFAVPLTQKNPFSLRDINMLAYIYDNMGKPDAAKAQMHKLRMLQKVISSTGYGVEQESPWYIILASNTDDMVALMGLEVTNSMISGANIEFKQVRTMPRGLDKFKGYYFEFSPIYKKEPTYLEDQPKEKRRMEINRTRPWELKKN